jgi:nucleotide-binding universal stress UspA family protein
MKKILIALDYDPSAEKIAQTGYAIAKGLGAQTTLLHVVADAGYYSDISYSPIMGFNGFLYPGIDEMLVKDLLEESHKFLNSSKDHLGDSQIETLVKEGEFVSTIIETAKEISADLIVLGTHSRRGLDRLLSGSIAEKMVQQSDIPLLIVPNTQA